jgi:hypothetical protein
MIAIFTMGNFDLLRNVIIASLILYALVRLAFLVTKLGSPAVNNDSTGRRASPIFNP